MLSFYQFITEAPDKPQDCKPDQLTGKSKCDLNKKKLPISIVITPIPGEAPVNENWEATIHYTDKNGNKQTQTVTSTTDIRKDVGKTVKELKAKEGATLHKVDYHE